MVSVQLAELRRARAEVAAVVGGEILEFQREIGGASRLDQVAAGDGERGAGPLLVAGEDEGDVGGAQRPRRMHGAQGGDDHHKAAFVVADAGAGGAVAVAGEGLERAVGLEHRIEMADQEDVAAAPPMGGDEMAGAPGLGHLDPAHGEAERLQLLAHHPADGAHALEVQRAAVPVHQPFEQGDRAAALAIDGLGHAALDRREAGRSRGRESEQGEEQQDAHGASHHG